MNPFQSVMANTSSSPTPFPARISLTPEQRASVDAAYAELVGGIETDVSGQAREHVGPSPEPDAGNANLGPNKMLTRLPLTGGTYTPENALPLLNSHFFIANVKGAYPIAQINDDGLVKYLSRKDFSLKLANLFVKVDDGRGGKKKVYVEKFWLSHPHREEREIIFDPKALPGITVPGKHNLWGGFAVLPKKPTGRHRRLLRHVHQVICQGNKHKFNYLIRWLAWAVQNPDKNPETVIVLKSARQGTGKTTLNAWMCRIFGDHARIISDKDRLFDRFNSDLETAVFVDADEMLWAGDRGTADKLKSLITGGTITLEVKHGARWAVPNRLHIIMTTNHDHAVQAGVQDRRFFVLEVSAHKAQDASWFNPLYADFDNGGVEEFLWFLLKVNLKGWHPRQLPKTSESIEQQRFSADSITQWAQACIDADQIVGFFPDGVGYYPLGQLLPSNVLYAAYKGHCRQHPANNAVFGKALTQMFGEPSRQKVAGGSDNSRRPRTYRVPDADSWQQALDQRLGIGARK